MPFQKINGIQIYYEEEYSVALMASDVGGLLRSLRIKKAHVVGVSLGGYIAQELALSQPDLVDRLVRLATSCGGPKYMELTGELAQKIPNAQLKVFPDAAHLLFLGKAQAVNQAIVDFLTSTPR